MTPEMYKKRWNPSQKNQCLIDFKSGITIEELAEKYQRSIGGIYVALVSGLRPKDSDFKEFVSKKKTPKSTKPAKESSTKKEKEPKIKISTSSTHAEIITPNLKEKMRQDYNTGMKVDELSQKYGVRSYEIVRCFLPEKYQHTNDRREKSSMKWSTQDHDYLMKMCYEKSVDDLAIDLKRSSKGIVCRLILYCIFDIDE